MSVFVKDTTYDVAVTDPETGEPAGNVTMRPLNSGDRAEAMDTMRMQAGEDSPEIKLGAFQLLLLERAIVKWTFEHEMTAATIRQLHPDVFDTLTEAVSFGSTPLAESVDESSMSKLDNSLQDTSLLSHSAA